MSQAGGLLFGSPTSATCGVARVARTILWRAGHRLVPVRLPATVRLIGSRFQASAQSDSESTDDNERYITHGRRLSSTSRNSQDVFLPGKSGQGKPWLAAVRRCWPVVVLCLCACGSRSGLSELVIGTKPETRRPVQPPAVAMDASAPRQPEPMTDDSDPIDTDAAQENDGGEGPADAASYDDGGEMEDAGPDAEVDAGPLTCVQELRCQDVLQATACCMSAAPNTAPVEAGTGDHEAACGLDLRAYTKAIATSCVSLAEPGEIDPFCPDVVVEGLDAMLGCCTPDGACGAWDDVLGLGCTFGFNERGKAGVSCELFDTSAGCRKVFARRGELVPLQGCVCDECLQEQKACRLDKGCVLLWSCMRDAGCRTQGECASAFDQRCEAVQNAANTESLKLAYGLGACGVAHSCGE